MKKQVKKELALLMCSYVFMLEGLKANGDVKAIERTEEDWWIINLIEKLKNLSPNFYKKEILNYYFTRLFLVKSRNDVDTYPLILGLFLYRLYLEFRKDTKYLQLGLNKKKTEKVLNQIKKEFGISKGDVIYAYEFALAFFPDKAGLISFKKFTNKLFGGEYIDDLFMLEAYEKGIKITKEIKEKANFFTDDILNNIKKQKDKKILNYLDFKVRKEIL